MTPLIAEGKASELVAVLATVQRLLLNPADIRSQESATASSLHRTLKSSKRISAYGRLLSDAADRVRPERTHTTSVRRSTFHFQYCPSSDLVQRLGDCLVLKKLRKSRIWFGKLFESLAIQKVSLATNDFLLSVEVMGKFDRCRRLDNRIVVGEQRDDYHTKFRRRVFYRLPRSKRLSGSVDRRIRYGTTAINERNMTYAP